MPISPISSHNVNSPQSTKRLVGGAALMANDRQISKVTSNEDIPSEFILSNRQIKKVKTNKSNKLKGGPQQNFKRILNVEKLDTETAQ